MRISFLIPGLHYGGVCRWALTLARNLRHVEVESFVSMGEGQSDAIEQEASRIAPVFTMPIREVSGALLIRGADQKDVLRRACAKADAVIVSAAGILPQVWDSVRHCARVVVSHVTPDWGPQAWRVREDAKLATHCVAVSAAAAECFQGPFTIIESGAEVDRIAPAGGVDWGIPSIGKVALYVGRISKAKGHHKLLDALHYLPPEWHVVFLGPSGSPLEMEGIKVRAVEEHPGRVVLAVADTRIGAALKAASCLVVTSDSEATPLVVLEAMLARLPIVSTEFKAIRDMTNQHGRIASLVAQDASPQALAQAIQESQHYYSTVLNAWEVAWSHYTAAAMADRWEKFLLAEIPLWQARQAEPTKCYPIQGPAVERIEWRPDRGDKPKVVCVSHPLGNIGGPGVWLRSLVRRTEHAIDWEIINISRDGKPDADILESIGVPYWINDCQALVNADMALLWGLPGIRRITAGFGGPMVCISHGAGTYETAAWVRSVEQACSRRVGVSKIAAAYYSLESEVIHNGIDVERLELPAPEEVVRAKTREAIGLNDNEFAIGMVGRIAADKNPVALARACAHLPSWYRPVFVGPDESNGALVREIREACPRALFVSPTENVAEMYVALDCLAITSPREGFCLAAVEAMHCGCPVLSTPVGIIPEIDEEFGQVAIPLPLDCNPGMVAGAIRIATRDSPRIGRGRQAAAHYTAERMAGKWLELIYEVLEWKHADCARA